MEKKKPLLSFRPRFDPGLALVESAPVTLVSVAAVTAAVGTLFYILFSIVGLTKFISGGAIYTSFFLLSLTLTPAVFYEVKKRAFSRTAYHFYDTYLEFQHFRFYVSRMRGRVRYDDIADVTQRASIFESLYGLTSIYIYVPSMGYQATGPFSGVKIADVSEKDNAAHRILDLIEHGAPVPAGVAAAAS